MSTNPYDAPLTSSHTTSSGMPSGIVQLRRIHPLSCAKVGGALYALMGLILGGIATLAAIVGVNANQAPAAPGPTIFFGVGAVIILPFVYGIGGAIAGLLSAWFYNLIAATVGGMEMQFSD